MFVVSVIAVAAMLLSLSLNWNNKEERTAGLPGTNAACLFNVARPVEWHYESVYTYETSATHIGIVLILCVTSILRLKMDTL